MDDFVVSREMTSHPQTDNGSNNNNDSMNPKQRACANCARLKMKCQWPASGSARPERSACVRCGRMKLSCHVPEAVPRKKRGKSTRVAQLEKKLDGIVELLAANQHIQPKGPPPLTPESPQSTQQSQPQPQPQSQPQLPPKDPYPFNGVDKTDDSPTAADLLIADVPFEEAPCLELLPGFRISQLEAANALETYRRDYVPVYPFVPLPLSLTASDLYSQSRFLFWTIMSVIVPMSGSVQGRVRAWFRKYLAEHVMVRQEKRIDILQAIFIHLGWNDFPFYMEPQATPVLQMAASLVIDLRLDRSPSCCHVAQKTLLGEAWQTMNKSHWEPRLKFNHSLEDKRAVLGYYHISSLLAILFRRGVPFPWSNFLAQCADALLEANQYESDQYLVALVRMHHIAERAYSVMRAVDFQDQVSLVFRAPLDMAINNARRELDSFVKKQPEVVRQNKIFWSHYHTLLIRLYEPVLMMKAPSISDSESLTTEPFLRAEALWKLVHAISNFYNHQFSIPAVDMAALPVTAGGFIAFSAVTTSRLLFAEASPDWDPSLARRRLDFPELLRRLSELYEEAHATAQRMNRRQRILDDGTSIFLKYSYKARWIRQWVVSKLPADEQQPAVTTAATATAASTATTVVTGAQTEVEGMPDWAANFQFDENFWQELMLMGDGDLTDVPLTNAMPLC
ncbi:hypothetical protein B0T10DRAFT_486368 [Thelonectria olida]|uniref:Zn(2)-C6 fungal-type domain-containing protein n=1 Tax=Thelonectria olida TaxID=1576542 RepID=A0A9P8W5F1_9HYPO|nr:hypothetical protein B0T10DRAFT_486368 [Thelonectria olida]